MHLKWSLEGTSVECRNCLRRERTVTAPSSPTFCGSPDVSSSIAAEKKIEKPKTKVSIDVGILPPSPPNNILPISSNDADENERFTSSAEVRTTARSR